jgi:hypothetical protein
VPVRAGCDIYYYHNMLSSEYREFITPSKYETLSELINFARQQEMELKKQVERGKKRLMGNNSSLIKKQRVVESPKKVESRGGSPPRCKSCGRNHWGNVCLRTNHATTVGRWDTELQTAQVR